MGKKKGNNWDKAWDFFQKYGKIPEDIEPKYLQEILDATLKGHPMEEALVKAINEALRAELIEAY